MADLGSQVGPLVVKRVNGIKGLRGAPLRAIVAGVGPRAAASRCYIHPSCRMASTTTSASSAAPSEFRWSSS